MKKIKVPTEAIPLAGETPTMQVSFLSPSAAPMFTVTTAYEFQPDRPAQFGAPLELKQD